MKLSDIRPCDNCGKQVAPSFYVVRISLAMVMPAANQVLGLMKYFNGNLALAEMMGPENDVVKVFGDDAPALMAELFLCHDCVAMGRTDLALLMEMRSNQEKERTDGRTD